ncbi:MAG: hypothetical protein QXS91_03705 [Candidatus Anstonellales archaeon]
MKNFNEILYKKIKKEILDEKELIEIIKAIKECDAKYIEKIFSSL